MSGMSSRTAILAGCLSASGAVPAASELNMLINQSPWFDGFRKTLEMYEAETGNSIELDVTPYPAMSEKVRNSIRAPEGIYDTVITSTKFMSTYYDSGLLEDINAIDPDYELDEGVCDYQGTSHWNPDRWHQTVIVIATEFDRTVKTLKPTTFTSRDLR